MDAETRPLDSLLEKWRELPVGDRKNILRRLPVEQRLTLQRVLAVSNHETTQATARTERFRVCSPWLGDLLDSCEKGGSAAQLLKPLVQAALLAGYEKVERTAAEPETSPSLTALAQSLIRSVRERL